MFDSFIMDILIGFIQGIGEDNKINIIIISCKMASKKQTPTQYLLIKLQNIEFRNQDQIQDHQFVYFSFSYSERMYFSSCIDTNTATLSDDIIIPIVQQSLPQFVSLHRWQNHMIMFTHQIDISQLKTRSTTKKKHQTKAGEILGFLVLVLGEEELKFGDKYVQSISQHYLILEQMLLKENRTQARADQGPSYYLVRASGSDFVMPILDGQICIKLPETLEFEHIKNGKSAGKSRQYSSSQLLQSKTQIQLTSSSLGTTTLQLSLKWGINFFQTKQQNSLLLQAHQLLIYDVQVKFDSYNQYSNSRVKFVYGNKAFEIGNEFNTAKPSKIKKIVYFIIKSQDQEINIIVERNLKIVGQSKFYTDQIGSYMVHFPKRKIIDENGKVIGNIKFRCEKAKNLSTPNNNKFWKESNKKKLINNILLSIQQISVNYDKDQPLCVTIKSETEQRTINNIPNFMFFDKNLEISYAPTVVSAKPDESVYLMVKNQEDASNNSQDFIGIAVLNFGQLKLGSNSTQITFFKNQGKTATMNCLINKVIPYPFVKSSFQPQILNSSTHKTLSLSLFLKKVVLTPYFYTYNYDNKNQLYCIIEVNRLKKVLIMENTIHDQLQFISSSSSDSLSFYIEDTEYIKVKITFLVSDVGHEQEIYGSAIVKFKMTQLNASNDGIKFNKIQIKNDFGTGVGVVGIEVNEGIVSGRVKDKKSIEIATGPFKSQIKRVQNDIHKINQNMEIMERSVKKKNTKSPEIQKIRKSEQIHLFSNKRPQPQSQARYDNSINYSDKRRQRNHSVAGTGSDSIKLPHIRQNNPNKRGNNLKDLINMMKIRKRDTRGYYEQNSNIKPYQPNYPASERAQYNPSSLAHQYDPPFHTEKGSRQNPQLERSMDIIFPQRGGEKKNNKNNIQNQIHQYEEKLKKLKSQLNNYNNGTHANENDELDDMMGARNTRDGFKKNSRLLQEPERDLEFEDNQFFRAPN